MYPQKRGVKHLKKGVQDFFYFSDFFVNFFFNKVYVIFFSALPLAQKHVNNN